MSRPRTKVRSAVSLTAGQRKVLRLCSLGCTVKEAARILRLRSSTVANHKKRAMARAQLHNLAELTGFAIRRRISKVSDALTVEERERLHRPNGRPAPALRVDVPMPRQKGREVQQ